ncbi:MAG: tryptophan-rich sensory protein [Telmatospirillum sp.]|nr:tryptophan-rich sensory protein [Telmatospirillum sp.]
MLRSSIPSATSAGSLLRLLAVIVVCLAVGGIAGAVTVPEVRGWYQTIAKPAFTPPDRVFGPVWSTLYPMMALAGWLAWRRDRFAWSSASLRLFLLQLALNFGWSFLFFSYHWLLAASIEVSLLWGAILMTVLEFRRRDSRAAILMLPYLLWVSLATALTWTIWSMNV